MEAKCVNHWYKAAVTDCRHCQKRICESCVMDVPGGPFCSMECSNLYKNVAPAGERLGPGEMVLSQAGPLEIRIPPDQASPPQRETKREVQEKGPDIPLSAGGQAAMEALDSVFGKDEAPTVPAPAPPPPRMTPLESETKFALPAAPPPAPPAAASPAAKELDDVLESVFGEKPQAAQDPTFAPNRDAAPPPEHAAAVAPSDEIADLDQTADDDEVGIETEPTIAPRGVERESRSLEAMPGATDTALDLTPPQTELPRDRETKSLAPLPENSTDTALDLSPPTLPPERSRDTATVAAFPQEAKKERETVFDLQPVHSDASQPPKPVPPELLRPGQPDVPVPTAGYGRMEEPQEKSILPWIAGLAAVLVIGFLIYLLATKKDEPKPVVVTPPPVTTAAPPVKPPAVTKVFDPWAPAKPGTWYRVRATGPQGESYTDIGLKQRGDGFIVVVTQSFDKGVRGPEREERIALAPSERVEEKAAEVAGTRIAGEVYVTKTNGAEVRDWRVKDGRHAGLAVKTDGARRLWEEKVRAAGAEFDCLAVETAAGSTMQSSACPLPVIAVEGKTRREIVAVGGDWSKRGKYPPEEAVARPDPPKPVPPPPKPVVRVFDAWAGAKPGTWYRTRTQGPDGESWTDVGLKERGDGHLVIVTQTYAGRRGAEIDDRVELREWERVEEKTVEISGLRFDGEIWAAAGAQDWRVKDGRHAGLAVKTDGARRLWEEKIKVAGIDFGCLACEAASGSTWRSASCPVEVRATDEKTRRELVAFGADWMKRPPFPPEDDAAQRQRTLEEAARLLKSARPLFTEVADTLDAGTTDRAALQSLLQKAEAAETKLYDAQLRYMIVRAADPTTIERRIREIDELMGTLKRVIAFVKGKLQ